RSRVARSARPGHEGGERHGVKLLGLCIICSDYASAVRAAFRQARPLAEGQKSADVKRISQYHPPPPTKTVGGGGRISREICRFFAFRAIIWRRGSNFPRKMQVLVSSSRHLAEGVLRSEVPPRLVTILNHASLPHPL